MNPRNNWSKEKRIFRFTYFIWYTMSRYIAKHILDTHLRTQIHIHTHTHTQMRANLKVVTHFSAVRFLNLVIFLMLWLIQTRSCILGNGYSHHRTRVETFFKFTHLFGCMTVYKCERRYHFFSYEILSLLTRFNLIISLRLKGHN